MPSYIQNYGFTKSIFQDNHHTLQNQIQWKGDYDGNIANIDINIDDNGNRELVSMQLDNNDIAQIFGTHPVEISLEKRLVNDFLSHKNNRPKKYTPITLEGALIKQKSRRHRKKHHKRRKTKRLY
jgi:hypothetical protein